MAGAPLTTPAPMGSTSCMVWVGPPLLARGSGGNRAVVTSPPRMQEVEALPTRLDPPLSVPPSLKQSVAAALVTLPEESVVLSSESKRMEELTLTLALLLASAAGEPGLASCLL